MNAPDAELKRLIEAKSAAVTSAALRDGGNVSQADVDDLDRLTRLLELQAPSPTTVFKRRWHMAALLFGTLVAVSVLLFARVRETSIELEIDATQVSFELASRQVLLEHVSLARIGAAGFTRIELPGLQDGGEGEATDLQAIAITAAGDAAGRGSVDLTHVAPAEGTRVTISHSDVPSEYRLSLIDPHFEVNVGVQGLVRLSTVGPEPVDIPNPRAIRLEATTGVVDLDLLFRDIDESGIIPQIPVRNLMFARVVDHSADVSVTRRLSTVNKGTLYFESLNGVERALRSGEALRFREAYGEIRALRLGTDQLTLNFQGRVRGMVTGALDNPQDLMPTWLEWLKAQHGLSLLWGSTFYLFGLVLTIGRWLKGAV